MITVVRAECYDVGFIVVIIVSCPIVTVVKSAGANVYGLTVVIVNIVCLCFKGKCKNEKKYSRK